LGSPGDPDPVLDPVPWEALPTHLFPVHTVLGHKCQGTRPLPGAWTHPSSDPREALMEHLLHRAGSGAQLPLSDSWRVWGEFHLEVGGLDPMASVDPS
jgi:hypothetical protein